MLGKVSREVEPRLLESRSCRIEEDGFGIELHGGADMAHTGLSCRHVVHLVAFGQRLGAGGCGTQEQKDFFHCGMIWVKNRKEITAKIDKRTSPTK